MTVGVMCTLRDAQATEKAAQLGLILICTLRFEEYQPTDFNKSLPDMGPLNIRPPLNIISRQKPPPPFPSRVGGFDQ